MESKNKVIIDNCPNFYRIINFDYFEEDYFTANLIKIYHSYVFSININNPEDLHKIKELDMVISKYIDDYTFRRTMKYNLLKVTFKKDGNLLDNLINTILKIFEQLQQGKIKKVYISKWI